MGNLFTIKGDIVSDTTFVSALGDDSKSLQTVLESSCQFAGGTIRRFKKSLKEYSTDDLCDISKEVAYECIRGFNPESGSPFSAYFVKALKNRFMKMVSYSSRIVSIDAGWDSEGNEDYGVMSIEDDSEYSLSRIEERWYASARLSHLIAGTADITESERRVLGMIYILYKEGVKVNDRIVAGRLGISRQAVSKFRNSVFRKIRESEAGGKRGWNIAG